MHRIFRVAILMASLSALAASWPGEALAQRGRAAPAPQHRSVRRSMST
jgi:hypothetical protein